MQQPGARLENNIEMLSYDCNVLWRFHEFEQHAMICTCAALDVELIALTRVGLSHVHAEHRWYDFACPGMARVRYSTTMSPLAKTNYTRK